MIHIKSFVFNAFQENTYILYDETKEAIIIDPGCQMHAERGILDNFIEKEQLNLVHLLNTHCHLDHVFGNLYFQKNYNLKLAIHQADVPVLAACTMVAKMYNLSPYDESLADIFLEEGQQIKFGNTILDILHLPGHAPGHLGFVNHTEKFIISGDVIFKGSIGRTDFPLCNHDHLMDSIKNKLFLLPDDYIIHTGHGQSTTIGDEKKNNPFFN
ncbi:MAG: MBL fold metallo-hydrolase [Bacteroidetes bacterium]|nr:MAG: MBL fold metallo-hydrolase [Bacteroidota bacterium]TAG90334.1 MAG: MBL fold metallo-hydrolase [Bacteroidota bacterium]